MLTTHPVERQYLSWVYSSLWHRERLYRKVNLGDSNKDKRILIIRPSVSDEVQGLMSLFIQALRWIDYADRMNFIPFVDFMNFKTQYYVKNENAWTFFFQQVSDLTFVDVYSSKNVDITGVTKKIVLNESLFKENIFTDNYS